MRDSKYHIIELDEDIEYVFCFAKKKIITERECEYYDFNCNCKKKGDIFMMTHLFGSNSGRGYCTSPRPLLNECRYCLDKDKLKEYDLSDEAYECLIGDVQKDSLYNKFKKWLDK